MDTFTQAYIEAALWSTNDESREDGGDPLDQNYTVEDIAPETLVKIEADCKKFLDDAKIVACIGDRVAHAGHDFWLTRNGHGCGFFDGDWPEPDCDYLTDRAHSFGEVYLYVGDDGKIYSN